jgi:pimeloyl-ACP methyl ester carboxylesterase
VRVREIDAGGAALTIREWGDAAATPVLFWHSVGPQGSGAAFAIAAEEIARAGLSVIAPDAPGFGLSPARPDDAYSLDRLGTLVWQIADALGIDRAVVCGHSWGGAVAVAAAGIAPGRTHALVLYDSGHVDYADWPGADLTVTREQLVAASAEDTRVESWDALVDLLAAERLDQPWMLEAWRESVRIAGDGTVEVRYDPRARGAALYALTYERPSAFWPPIADAGIPTLVLLATEPPEVAEANDRLVERFVDAVPQAEVMRLEGCRHQLFADLGPRSGELVAEWLLGRGLV